MSAPISETPEPQGPTTEAGREHFLRWAPDDDHGNAEEAYVEAARDFRKSVLAIEAEARAAAPPDIDALRERVEALPTNHINWHDYEGNYDEHCHVVKVTDVLALLASTVSREP